MQHTPSPDTSTVCPNKWLLRITFIIGSLLVLIQILFLNNSTIQILPRVFLPNTLTYIAHSSIIFQNDNKLIVFTQKESEKIYRRQENNTMSTDGAKGRKSKTKSEQYIVYKFSATFEGHMLMNFERESVLFQRMDEKTSFYNGNMTIHNPNPTAYLTVSGSPIYITSAHGRFGAEPENITFYTGRNKTYSDGIGFPDFSSYTLTEGPVNFISITGWLHESLLQEDLHCCLLLKNQSVVSYLNRRRLLWYQVKKQPYFATKSYCPIPAELQSDKPIGASVALPPLDCYLETFMKIEDPQTRKRNSLALCSKIAYGELSADRLIEWLETQKYIGVDKVMIYYYNLNTDAMNVLNNYVDEGLVDLQPFDIPEPDAPTRYIGEKEAQSFIDEQVAVYDCIERLKSYHYVGIVDLDEIIYSRITYRHNLKALLKYLNRRYPNASGYSFMTEIFITNWFDRKHGPRQTGSETSKSTQTGSNSKLWHAKYLNRTAPMVDRVKSVINLERAVLDSIWTHNFTSLPGFQRYKISSSLGCLKHYRSCREQWLETGKCFSLRRYPDCTIANLMNNINDTILRKKEALLGFR